MYILFIIIIINCIYNYFNILKQIVTKTFCQKIFPKRQYMREESDRYKNVTIFFSVLKCATQFKQLSRYRPRNVKSTHTRPNSLYELPYPLRTPIPQHTLAKQKEIIGMV